MALLYERQCCLVTHIQNRALMDEDIFFWNKAKQVIVQMITGLSTSGGVSVTEVVVRKSIFWLCSQWLAIKVLGRLVLKFSLYCIEAGQGQCGLERACIIGTPLCAFQQLL